MAVELTSVIRAEGTTTTQLNLGMATPAGSNVHPRVGVWNPSEVSRLETPAEGVFPPNLAKLLSRKRNETFFSRVSRARKILNLELHKSVLNRLCKIDYEGLKRVSNFVESIIDAIVFSTPDVDTRSPDFKRILKWAYSIAVYRTDSGTRQWKEFASLLKWYALRSETAKPSLPEDLVGFGDQFSGDFPPIWYRLCPWMKSIVQSGAETKLDLARVAHFTSSRGLPSGDAMTRRRSLQNHRTTLSSLFAETPERRGFLYEAARLIGSGLIERLGREPSSAHLSLTTSSSFDYSVREGGRAAEIREKFRTWMEFVPSKTIEGSTLLGTNATEICGFPRWMTVGRYDPLDFIQRLPHDDEGAIHPTVLAGESRQDTFFDFENFRYEDPIYGLDETTGYQLHQWSVYELLDLQILSGDPTRPLSLSLVRDNLPLVRRSTIGEPGAKSRVVTIGEACLTIFLQPFSHQLASWLRKHPSAQAGFTRAAQGFEYVKGLHQKEHPAGTGQSLKMLSSDLTTATDFCVHSYSQAMLDGFHAGLNKEIPYHRLSSQLLCSARRVIDNDDVWTTTRGVLMGDPGAKCVLTLHNLCAELEALIRHRSSTALTDSELFRRTAAMEAIPSAWWRCFACSGDDHIAIGPEEYLREITRSHDRNGMSVSWPQNFVSSVGAVYCEEFLLISGYSTRQIFVSKFLWQLEHGSHVHVDALKLRLLSPCSKEHEGKDEPNPGIGKSHQLKKVLGWLEPPLSSLKKWASWRFSDRFSSHLPRTYQKFLPVSLGGLDTPCWHMESHEVLEGLINLSSSHLTLIRKVLEGSSTHMDRRVLSSFASNARARGIDSDLVGDQVREFLANPELVKAIDVEQIQSVVDVDPDTFKSWNIRKKLAAASAAGFISINDAINMIERPYIFRDLLFPDMSEAHGYKPKAWESYSAKSWGRRSQVFNSQLDTQVPLGGAMPLSVATAQLIADAVVNGDLLEIPPSNLLIPRDVVAVESRPQLRTPY
jgi:hypothetical protein